MISIVEKEVLNALIDEYAVACITSGVAHMSGTDEAKFLTRLEVSKAREALHLAIENLTPSPSTEVKPLLN